MNIIKVRETNIFGFKSPSTSPTHSPMLSAIRVNAVAPHIQTLAPRKVLRILSRPSFLIPFISLYCDCKPALIPEASPSFMALLAWAIIPVTPVNAEFLSFLKLLISLL